MNNSRGSIKLGTKGKNNWRIRIEFPKDVTTGKRIQKCFTYYGTKKDAEKF